MKKEISNLLNKVALKLLRMSRAIYSERLKIPPECHFEGLGNLALDYVLKDKSFATVLDVGSGSGIHSDYFTNNGKSATRFDFGRSRAFTDQSDVIIGDFLDHQFQDKYDLVWASHVLEHSVHTHEFLEKLSNVAKPDSGILAITVPPAKAEFVGGHVSLWTPALLLYRMVLAGIDCSQAKVMVYGYNISVICENKRNNIDLSGLAWDYSDIERISGFLPNNISAGSDGARYGEIYQDAEIYLS